MKTIKNYFEKISGVAPTEFTFVPNIKTDDIAGVEEILEPDSCYLELYLESLKLEKARRFATKFHGVVYSFIELSQEAQTKAQIASVSKPENLIELDKKSLDNVITISKQLMAPVAFRGGALSLELGLFSVKSGNILTPLLDYVTKISRVAGISYIGKIKPFVPLITEGMNLIAGQLEDTSLEVGIDTDIHLSKSFVGAIIALPKSDINTDDLRLDQDRKLLLNDKPLECGYAVFSIRRTTQKHDYGEIPELSGIYETFLSALRKNKRKDAKELLGVFRLALIASPDLISSDSERLFKKAEKRFLTAFPPGGLASASMPLDIEEESLYDLKLYE